eukprot:765987-Hanusia_phi.AAC.2
MVLARWLAEEGLYADLPAGYKEMKDFTGNPYYYNETTKTAAWEHPLDELYRKKYASMRSLHDSADPRVGKLRQRFGPEHKIKEEIARQEHPAMAFACTDSHFLRRPPSPPFQVFLVHVATLQMGGFAAVSGTSASPQEGADRLARPPRASGQGRRLPRRVSATDGWT